MDRLTVSELSRRVGVSADAVRYYERLGLLPEAKRSPAGYRLFSDDDVERMRFIKRAQRFGLQLQEIGELLEIRERGLCPCGHARNLLAAKVAEIEEQLASLAALRDDLSRLLRDGLAPAGDRCWPCEPRLLQIEGRPQGDNDD